MAYAIVFMVGGAALLAVGRWCGRGPGEERSTEAPGVVERSPETRHAPVQEPAAIQVKSGDTFQWSQIEADDLRQYVARLRTMGCPEITVRDIIIGIINRRYAPRLKALRPPEDYWQGIGGRAARGREMAKRESARQELVAERNRLVRELLGIDLEDYLAGTSDRPDEMAKLLENVSEAARPRARQVLLQYQALEISVSQRCGGTLGMPEQAELQDLYRRKVQELKSILTPRELEDYELRASPLALRLRTIDLAGFAPTEEEFRQIFHIRNAMEDPSGPAGQPVDANEESNRSLAAQQGEFQIRQALGEKRYGEYQRSQDVAYRRTLELTDHYGLPGDAAAQMHDMRNAVFDQAETLRYDIRLSPAARQQMLSDIQQETSKAMMDLLGPAAYESYSRGPDGRWINAIPSWTNGVVLRNN